MQQRRKARRDALEILYQREITGESLSDVVEGRVAARGEESNEFSLRLAHGVVEHQREIDELMGSHADNWAIERMPVVDRNIIRIGLYEMLYEEEIPYSVSINEAVELAKLFGTDDSSKFVNGVLGHIAQELRLADAGPKKAAKPGEAGPA